MRCRIATAKAEAAPAKETLAEAGAVSEHAQRFAPGADVPGAWWTLFGSPGLTALVAEALRHNPTLKSQAATLRQAQETTLAQQGALFPTVSAQFNRARQEVSPAEAGVSAGGPISSTTYSSTMRR
jgi:outer membrane protein TolC